MTDHIDKFVRKLNDCWQSGRLAELASFYHPDAVLLPPDDGVPIIGRDNILNTYRDFTAAAVLYEFQITELECFSFPAVADDVSHPVPVPHPEPVTHVVHMRFEIEYELGDVLYRESGLEVYAIMEAQEDSDSTKVVWRSQSVLDNRVLNEPSGTL